MSLSIRIKDWYGLHKGFTLHLEEGFTALVGPNGAGKSTLLHQIEEYAEKKKIRVWEYSNLSSGGTNAMDFYLNSGEMALFSTAATSSEGEQVAMNFSNKVGELGAAIRMAKEQRKPLFVLLDAIDSGASIDRARDLRDLFDLIYENDVKAGAEVYVVMAVNHYELAKAPTDCVDVRDGRHLSFWDYKSYADFICSFEKEHPRID